MIVGGRSLPGAITWHSCIKQERPYSIRAVNGRCGGLSNLGILCVGRGRGHCQNKRDCQSRHDGFSSSAGPMRADAPWFRRPSGRKWASRWRSYCIARTKHAREDVKWRARFALPSPRWLLHTNAVGTARCAFAHPTTSPTVIASQRVGAKRRPMTGSAKQSIAPQEGKSGLFRRLRLRPKAGFGGQERSSQ
jgi:hypothetical protein